MPCVRNCGDWIWVQEMLTGSLLVLYLSCSRPNLAIASAETG